jgi:three-Cys-motif partner protein
MAKKPYNWRIGDDPPFIKPHSIAKQKVYTQYIERYIRTLNSNPLIPNFKIVIVDAFAGGGEYLTEDGNKHNGSPIKIIETVKNTEKSINSDRINEFSIQQKYFFIEKKKSNFEYLKNHLKSLEYDQFFEREIVLKKGKFEELYKDVVNQIHVEFGKKVRAIFILDQYGYTDAPFSIIRDIFDHLPNAEIILTMAVDSLIDYICDPKEAVAEYSDLFGNQKQEKVNSGLQFQQTLKAKLGLDLAELHKIKQKDVLWRGIIENMLIDKLKLLSGAKFYTPFFLSEENKHRDMWLVHLSNHSQARHVMGEVHWDVANHEKTKMNHYGVLGFQGINEYTNQLFDDIEDFSFNAEAKHKMKMRNMEDIPKALHNNPLSFKEFYASIANNTPAHKEHFRGYMQELLQLKELSITGKNGEQRRVDVKDDDIIKIPPQQNLFF